MQFQTGKTYQTRNIVDSDQIISLTVASRRAISVVLMDAKAIERLQALVAERGSVRLALEAALTHPPNYSPAAHPSAES